MQDPDMKWGHFGSNELCIKEGSHFEYMVNGSLFISQVPIRDYLINWVPFLITLGIWNLNFQVKRLLCGDLLRTNTLDMQLVNFLFQGPASIKSSWLGQKYQSVVNTKFQIHGLRLRLWTLSLNLNTNKLRRYHSETLFLKIVDIRWWLHWFFTRS